MLGVLFWGFVIKKSQHFHRKLVAAYFLIEAEIWELNSKHEGHLFYSTTEMTQNTITPQLFFIQIWRTSQFKRGSAAEVAN